MPVKLSHMEIKDRLDVEKYTLLDTTYVNNILYRIKYKCPNSHIHEVTWKNWTQDRRCRYCASMSKRGKSINQPSRLTMEEISTRLFNEGFILLDTFYVGNCLTRIEYKCSKGHISNVTWKNWLHGCRCRPCNLKNLAKKRRHSLEFVRESLLTENYELLSNKYVNCSTKFKYRCPYGHMHSVIWINWLRGTRCPTCHSIKYSGPGHPQWRGGVACEPYCDAWADKEYKESIKERDGYRCQNPGCWQTSNILAIHHIDYDKMNCRPNNLITLCRSCNARANKDREFHTVFYKNLLTERLGYVYE